MAITPETKRPSVELDQDAAVTPGERRTLAIERITVGQLIWFVIFLLAMISRLWDLGARALHHDESLHTYYSWIFSEGLGYSHHPMMHGPFLFHINALSYLLFGASDYTSRLTAGLFGVILVMLPWLLRGRAHLGPWGAMAASLLILVSPSILYYSRFIRHDIFAIVGVMLLFIAVVRYLEKPASRWIILAVGATGFVLTTHEITFANLGLFALFMGALIVWRVLPIAIPIVITAVVLFFPLRAALYAAGVEPIPAIPWQEPSTRQVIDYFIDTVTHPVTLGGIGLIVASLIAIIWLLSRRRPAGTGWIDGTLGTADPETVAGRFGIALHDRRGWGLGAIVGGSIFVFLYTSLFSNFGGLGTGTFGSVGYWLGQHDVQRGEQPWFYYLVLAPQYEYLAILGSFVVGLFLFRYAWKHRTENLELHRRFLTLAFAAWWAAMMFLVLSWAGEKMPWLIVHFMLPMLVLTGGGIGLVCDWLEALAPQRRQELARQTLVWGLPAGLLVVCAFLLLNHASAGPFIDGENGLARTIRDDIPGSWWIVFVPAIGAIGVAVIALIRNGWRNGLVISGATVGTLLLLLQVHAGWNLNYREGDVPRDMLVYVQTSPDLHQTVYDLQDLSHELTGGMDLSIYYSGGVQWPLNWYLREFNQRVLFYDIHDIPDAPIIIMASNEVEDPEADRLQDYSYIELPLRWWIPEDATYRRFAIAPEVRAEWRRNLQTDDPPPYSVVDVVQSLGRTAASLRHPEQQAKLFRLIVHRELSAPIGDYSMRVYIHDDYQRHFDGLRYAEPD